MNEIYSFHKELNIKKIIFVIVLALCIIIISSIIIIKILFAKPEEKIPDSYNTFTDKNNSIILTLPEKYGLYQVTPENNRSLQLKSNKNLGIFVSCENLLSNRKLFDIVSADIDTYTKEFNDVSNISDLGQFTINDSLGYTYSFNYLDPQTNVTYYLQVIWIEINDRYYIIDFEFPSEDLNDYTDIINETLDNLKINIDN